MRFVSIGLFAFGLILWNYYDGVLMRNFTYFNQISVEYALLGSLNSVAFLMAAQTAMYVSGYEKASVFVMCLSLAVLVYRPLFFLKFVGGEVSKAMLLLVLLGTAIVFMTRRKGTAKSVAGYAALGLASFMMGLLVFGKINANSELIPRICESSETACLDKLFNQRRLDVGFADMIQSKFYFEDCMYGEGGTFIDKAPARKCMDNFRPCQMPCEERGLAPEARISDLAKDVGPSYLPWPPVDPAPKTASNPYAWMGVMMANEWFDNMFWVDLGIRAIYMVLIGALQVHPMENGKLTLERIAALDVRLVEVFWARVADSEIWRDVKKELDFRRGFQISRFHRGFFLAVPTPLKARNKLISQQFFLDRFAYFRILPDGSPTFAARRIQCSSFEPVLSLLPCR